MPTSKPTPLSAPEVTQALGALPGWSADGGGRAVREVENVTTGHVQDRLCQIKMTLIYVHQQAARKPATRNIYQRLILLEG